MSEDKKNKTVKDAYFSWKGLGLFDLIPGIRDLSYPIRLILMVVTLTIVLTLLYLSAIGLLSILSR